MRNPRFDLRDNGPAKKREGSPRKSSKRSTAGSFIPLIVLIIASILVEYIIFHGLSNASWIESAKSSTRVSNIYDEDHPLISVENLSEAFAYEPFQPFSPPLITSLVRNVKATNRDDDMSVTKTRQVLASMGVAMNDTDFDWSQLPPWSQIIANYHDGGDGDEPVLLGLDRCQAFRDSVPPHIRAIGPAGMFSTGTNLLHDLMYENCNPPKGASRSRKKFDAWQVPWGKHNPEESRRHHAAPRSRMWNQSATLPVVMIRHPYSWMHAMCKHSYSARWNRRKESCNQTASLHNPVTIRFGSKKNSTNHPIPTTYPSVAHLYQEWYLPYFQQTTYPAVFARVEDLVFRPKQVVKELCQCVGGNIVPDHRFEYQLDSANNGGGHGKHRSDLLSAFVKYGVSPEEYYSYFSATDKVTMEKVFSRGEGLYEALGYRLLT